MQYEEVELKSIVIGDRYRKKPRKIEELAQTIERDGLMQPVVISTDGTLIAGLRRCKAFEHLGRERIPAVRMDMESKTMGEFIENFCREDLTNSEKTAICRAVLPIFEKRAKERKAQAQGKPQGVKKGSITQNFAEETENGEAMAQAANAVGWSRTQLRHAIEVEDSGDEELIELMNRKNVHAAHTELRRREQVGEPEIVEKKFIYDDVGPLKNFLGQVDQFNSEHLIKLIGHSNTHGLSAGAKKSIRVLQSSLALTTTELEALKAGN
jgi:hypothetical protein